MPGSKYDYDVALSFAGEDRAYVEVVAKYLKKRKIRVFYDRYERAGLWGQDLYEHLARVYAAQSQYVVLFISRHYAEKVWTNHERKSAQARALKQKGEYILPARFDDTGVPGLQATVGYVNIAHLPPEELGRIIEEKLKHKRSVRDERDPDASVLLLQAAVVISLAVVVGCTYLGLREFFAAEDGSVNPFFTATATMVLMLFVIGAPFVWDSRDRK